MTLEQLEELRAKRPELIDNTTYIEVRSFGLTLGATLIYFTLLARDDSFGSFWRPASEHVGGL